MGFEQGGFEWLALLKLLLTPTVHIARIGNLVFFCFEERLNPQILAIYDKVIRSE